MQVLVFDLDTWNQKFLSFLINLISQLTHKDDITLIIASSVFTWAKTPPKIKIEGQATTLLG